MGKAKFLTTLAVLAGVSDDRSFSTALLHNDHQLGHPRTSNRAAAAEGNIKGQRHPLHEEKRRINYAIEEKTAAAFGGATTRARTDEAETTSRGRRDLAHRNANRNLGSKTSKTNAHSPGGDGGGKGGGSKSSKTAHAGPHTGGGGPAHHKGGGNEGAHHKGPHGVDHKGGGAGWATADAKSEKSTPVADGKSGKASGGDDDDWWGDDGHTPATEAPPTTTEAPEPTTTTEAPPSDSSLDAAPETTTVMATEQPPQTTSHPHEGDDDWWGSGSGSWDDDWWSGGGEGHGSSKGSKTTAHNHSKTGKHSKTITWHNPHEEVIAKSAKSHHDAKSAKHGKTEGDDDDDWWGSGEDDDGWWSSSTSPPNPPSEGGSSTMVPSVAPTPCDKAGKDCGPPPSSTDTAAPSRTSHDGSHDGSIIPAAPTSAPPSVAPTPCGKAGKECEGGGGGSSAMPSAAHGSDHYMTMAPVSGPETLATVPPSVSVTTAPVTVATQPPVGAIATGAPTTTEPADDASPTHSPTNAEEEEEEETVPPPAPKNSPATAPPAPIPIALVPITMNPVSESPTEPWPTWSPTSNPVSALEALQGGGGGTWFQSGKAYDVEMSQYRARGRANGDGVADGIRGRTAAGGKDGDGQQ